MRKIMERKTVRNISIHIANQASRVGSGKREQRK